MIHVMHLESGGVQYGPWTNGHFTGHRTDGYLDCSVCVRIPGWFSEVSSQWINYYIIYNIHENYMGDRQHFRVRNHWISTV